MRDPRGAVRSFLGGWAILAVQTPTQDLQMKPRGIGSATTILPGWTSPSPFANTAALVFLQSRATSGS